MQTVPEPIEGAAELAPQTIIRVETAFSRFPVHRLGTKSNVKIDILERSEAGEVNVKWEVRHQPGPLAYKIDTLIVNRRIEEASRPLPAQIKLGSLRQICRELGISDEGKGTKNVKDALSQNAEAFIKADMTYRAKDGSEKSFEGHFTRYSVVFTGQTMPDGARANAVYIVLNPLFMQALNGAMTRPLDYDYLKGLPPGPQRFYEILSYQVFAALKYNRPKARLVYSHYCTYAPQTRYYDYDRVKKQMFKVHAEHRKSGYIKSVEFEATTDSEGKADWIISYVPGPKARAEFRAFTKKGGGSVLEVEQPLVLEQPEELHPLEIELAERGVTREVARELLASHPENEVKTQIEHFDFLSAKSPDAVRNPGAWLPDAIRKRYSPPKGFETREQRERAKEAKDEAERKEAAEKQRARERDARDKAIREKINAYWEGLTPEEQTKLTAEALKEADPVSLQKFEGGDRYVKQFHFRTCILNPYLRRKLGLPQETEE